MLPGMVHNEMGDKIEGEQRKSPGRDKKNPTRNDTFVVRSMISGGYVS